MNRPALGSFQFVTSSLYAQLILYLQRSLRVVDAGQLVEQVRLVEAQVSEPVLIPHLGPYNKHYHIKAQISVPVLERKL